MMGAAIKVSTRRHGDGRVELSVSGEIDLNTIGRFENALRAAVAQAGPGRMTAVDLSGVEYLDSAAINVLFALAGRINLIRVNPLLVRGLTISGLDQVVEVQPVQAKRR